MRCGCILKWAILPGEYKKMLLIEWLEISFLIAMVLAIVSLLLGMAYVVSLHRQLSKQIDIVVGFLERKAKK